MPGVGESGATCRGARSICNVGVASLVIFTGLIDLPILGGIKQCKCIGNFEGFPCISRVHSIQICNAYNGFPSIHEVRILPTNCKFSGISLLCAFFELEINSPFLMSCSRQGSAEQALLFAYCQLCSTGSEA